MNIWLYIALFFIGYSAGMISLWYIIRNRISSKEININKAKTRGGPGNVQDIDMELKESENLTKRELRLKKKFQKKLDKEKN